MNDSNEKKTWQQPQIEDISVALHTQKAPTNTESNTGGTSGPS